jgi:hypothetical protein
MEALSALLMGKIKTLNEAIWENRANEPAIKEWLDNFSASGASGPDERMHALFLLSNFMFFGDKQIRGLLRALYRDLYRYPIIRGIRRNNGDTLDGKLIERMYREELSKTRFLGVGNPSESGCHLLYYFRQENNLPKDLFIHTHEIFARSGAGGTSQLRDDGVSRYVFIDDFCGSGKQGTAYSRDLVEDIKRLKPDVSVGYYVLLATQKGINKVRNETKFDPAKAIYELDASFRCFSADSRYFHDKPSEIDPVFSEQMCRTYGQRLMRDPADALGFDDSQLLVGFHHNTPDNTLPIMWFDEPQGAPWKPIFRRYPKLEWVIT